MKNTFEYAKKKEEKCNRKEWFKFKHGRWNCYYFLVPLIPIAIACEKIHKFYNNKLTWSERKATKVLNSILPKILWYNSENDTYSYDTECQSWIFVDNAPLRYKSWIKKYRRHLENYLKDGYENPLYNKSIKDEYIIFSEKYLDTREKK